jgi:phage FluMu gp28-like protein
MSAMPPVFLSYQQELMQSVSTYAVTVAEKGRRIGYSWGAAAIAAMTAAATAEAFGMDVLYMGYEKEMTREFIDDVAMWAKLIGAAASEVGEDVFVDPDKPEADIKVFRIDFASGHKVLALPNVPRALRSKQGLIILDEAAFMDNLAEVLKAALAHVIWGGKVLIFSTHNGTENPFNELVGEIRAGKKPYHLLRVTFEDAMAQGLYQRICLKRHIEWSREGEAAFRAEIYAIYGDNADEELGCIPREGGGKAIPRSLIEKRMNAALPVLRWACDARFVHQDDFTRTAAALAWCEEFLKPLLAALDPATPCVFGEDFARKRDLSVIVPLQILPSMLRRAPFLVELRNVPFDQQREILFYICDRLPKLRAGKLDAGGNGMYLAEKAMQKYGEGRIECVQFSEPWYRENMPKLKAAFEDGTIEIPQDRDVLDDIALLELVRGVIRVPERTLGSDGEGRHGDAAIALALAWAASIADVEIYELALQAAPKTRQARDWPDTAEEWVRDMDSRLAEGGILYQRAGGIL